MDWEGSFFFGVEDICVSGGIGGMDVWGNLVRGTFPSDRWRAGERSVE